MKTLRFIGMAIIAVIIAATVKNLTFLFFKVIT